MSTQRKEATKLWREITEQEYQEMLDTRRVMEVCELNAWQTKHYLIPLCHEQHNHITERREN